MPRSRVEQGTLLAIIKYWLRSWRLWLCLLVTLLLVYLVPPVAKVPAGIGIFCGLGAILLKNPSTSYSMRAITDVIATQGAFIYCWMRTHDASCNVHTRWRQGRVRITDESIEWRPYWLLPFHRQRPVIKGRFVSTRISFLPERIPIKPSARKTAQCYELVGQNAVVELLAVGPAAVALEDVLARVSSDGPGSE